MNTNKLALYSALLSYLLSIFILILANINEAGFNLYYGWLYPILPSFLLYWIVKGMKNWAWVLIIPIWALLFGEIFTLYFYHTPYSIHIVQLLINTNTSESSDFIREAITSSPFLYTLLTFVGIAFIPFAIIKWLVLPNRLATYLRYFGIALLLGSTGLLTRSYLTLHERFQEEDVSYFVLHRDDKPCYFTSVTRLLNGFAYAHASSFLSEKVKSHLLEPKVDSCSYNSPLIVMVIGESYDKYHTPLYNSDYRNTTPNLCALWDKDSLLVFDDVVAPYNMTNELFHALFSTCPYDSLNRWYNYTLFPAIFRKAGYNVSFLSNQFALHNNDIWNHYTGNIFNTPEMSAFQFTYHNTEVYPYDGELLQLLPDTSVLTSSPHLLIIHFIGQHVSYDERYPEAFRYYYPEDTVPLYGGWYGKQIVADYDNSLRYNDHVIRQIIDYIQSLDAIMLYFSDHGEECYDWRDAFMRTSEPTIPKEVAKYQYETPFVVYMTERYTKNHPDIAQTMRAATHLPIYNSDMTNVLFHLAGIHTSDYYPNRDFLSPEYDISCPRIIRDQEDYNTIIMKSTL